MKRLTTTCALASLVMVMSAGPVSAMQPPGHGAQDQFGCVDGQDQPVAGHPGAAGLTHAAPRVGALTDDSSPTAWNAVEHADPIELGSC